MDKYASLLEYFGEDPNLMCQDFFAVLSRFASEFTAAREGIDRQRKAEERREKLRIDAENRAAAKAAQLATATRVQKDNKSLHEMGLVIPGSNEQIHVTHIAAQVPIQSEHGQEQQASLPVQQQQTSGQAQDQLPDQQVDQA